MSSISSNSSTELGGEGNTKPLPPKQISPARRWCFTLNNYTNIDISSIVQRMEQTDILRCVIGKEVGELCGTPHLQGYFEFQQKKKGRPFSLGLTKRIQWFKCRGNTQQNIEYCQKEQNVLFSKGIPLPIKLINPDFDWEREILSIIVTEPNDRTIHWYWGVGNVGKTSFCKYLTVKHEAIALGGKGADMRNGVVEYKKTNGTTPGLVLINIPRSFNTDYISYEGIENIKDMYFYSGKYEGGMICGNCPHIFVFANEPPDYLKLSSDRWRIVEINNNN